MSRQYTLVQSLLPRVLAMREEGCTYRQIADQLGYTKKQIEELCSRERRKQRKIENGYVLQEYKGYRYYKENPSLAIWEVIERVLVECGLA